MRLAILHGIPGAFKAVWYHFISSRRVTFKAEINPLILNHYIHNILNHT